MMTIEDIVVKFKTTPFLFVGSGMSRRYYGLPDWNGLLEHFSKIVKEDEFAYNMYVNKAKTEQSSNGVLPKVAELIQKDYDELWFNDARIRNLSADELEHVKKGVSPFKVEITAYLKSLCKTQSDMEDEIKLFEAISEKSIAGVITTNYDDFLEKHLTGFKKYVGQSQLIFSAIQGVAEIYKIHGSVDDPNSIIINDEDYNIFNQKSAYLAAKLMTIFVENPIVFMGYSISDKNVQNILKSIVDCLDENQFKKLENRFVFVEYVEQMIGSEVSTYTIMIDGKPLNMTKIQLSDYSLLYNALNGKRSQLPIRLLRRFKEEIYEYVITSTPTTKLRVAALDDTRIADEELVINIGKMSDFGLKGLNGLEADDIYRDIIINDLECSVNDLLDTAYMKLLKQNSSRLPIFKYLSQTDKDTTEYREQIKIFDYDDLMSKTIKNNRKCLGEYTSPMQIWKNEKQQLEKATRLISHLPEEQMDLDELEKILKELFENDINVLKNSGSESTHIRRLIRVYDYLKWEKGKEPSN